MNLPTEEDIIREVRMAIKYYWETRFNGVLNGKTMDGFEIMLRMILTNIGIKNEDIFTGRSASIPGYFRVSKDWDFVVTKKLEDNTRRILAAIEFKSMFGSVGNNLNNRAEEAIGGGFDFSKAYTYQAFGINKPFTGYVFLLGEHEDNLKGTVRKKTLVPVFDEFVYFPRTQSAANNSEKLELLLSRLVQEGIYNNAALIIAYKDGSGNYYEPNVELSMSNFVKNLVAYIMANK